MRNASDNGGISARFIRITTKNSRRIEFLNSVLKSVSRLFGLINETNEILNYNDAK